MESTTTFMNKASTGQMLGRCLNCVHRSGDMVPPDQVKVGFKIYIRRFEKKQKACRFFRTDETLPKYGGVGVYEKSPDLEDEDPRQEEISCNLPPQREHLCIGFKPDNSREKKAIEKAENALIDGDLETFLTVAKTVKYMPDEWNSAITENVVHLRPNCEGEKKNRTSWSIEVTKAIQELIDQEVGLDLFESYMENRRSFLGNLAWWLVSPDSPFSWKREKEDVETEKYCHEYPQSVDYEDLRVSPEDNEWVKGGESLRDKAIRKERDEDEVYD